MSGTGFLDGLLLLVALHIPLAVMCLLVYEQQQRLAPGSRIQFSLVDCFLFTVAAALTISAWMYYAVQPYYEPSAQSIVTLIFLLSNQLAGVLIMRLQPRTNWNNHPFFYSFMDVLIGSLIGLFVMTNASAICAMTLVLWLPIWLIYRLRKRSQRRAAALLGPGNAEKHL